MILSYWYFCAVNAARGPLAGLSTAVRRVIGMIHLVNSLGTSWTVRSAKLRNKEEGDSGDGAQDKLSALRSRFSVDATQ